MIHPSLSRSPRPDPLAAPRFPNKRRGFRAQPVVGNRHASFRSLSELATQVLRHPLQEPPRHLLGVRAVLLEDQLEERPRRHLDDRDASGRPIAAWAVCRKRRALCVRKRTTPEVRDVYTMRDAFLADLEALGLRHRRLYDSKRTFISLIQADGARKDILHWITHGPGSDIVDVYTSLPWDAVCTEVAKLRIGFREGKRSLSGSSQARARRRRKVNP
jgi:hypothetical protein